MVGDAQSMAADFVDILRPRIDEGDILAGSRHMRAGVATDRPGPHDDNAPGHAIPLDRYPGMTVTRRRRRAIPTPINRRVTEMHELVPARVTACGAAGAVSPCRKSDRLACLCDEHDKRGGPRGIRSRPESGNRSPRNTLPRHRTDGVRPAAWLVEPTASRGAEDRGEIDK